MAQSRGISARRITLSIAREYDRAVDTMAARAEERGVSFSALVCQAIERENRRVDREKRKRAKA